MPLQKSRKNHHALHLSISPPSSTSFHRFDNDAPLPPCRHNSSSPSSAKSSTFAVDKSRTRKHSFGSSGPMWSELMPSIQGVMGVSGPKTPKAGTFGFGRRGSRSPDERAAGQWTEKSGDTANREASELHFASKKQAGSGRTKRESLRLPIMAPLLSPPIMMPRSFSSPDTSAVMIDGAQGYRSNGTMGHTQYAASTTSAIGFHHADHSPRPTARRSSRTAARDASPFTHNYTLTSQDKRRPSGSSQPAEDGWDVVSLAPSTSSSTFANLHDSASHAATATYDSPRRRPAKLYVDPEIASLSDEVDLRACEVLEHLESHLLSSGWGDAVYRQHQQYTTSTVSLVTTGKKDKETGSMRSWRDGRRNRAKTLQRPLSEQAPPPSIAAQVKASLARQESNNSSRTDGPPDIPPRHASRPAGVSISRKAETGAGYWSPGASQRVRQRDTSTRPPLVLELETARGTKDAISSLQRSDLPLHLRPLPPTPEAVPARSSFLLNKLHSRLLRSKRPSTAPSTVRPASPLSVANISSPISPSHTGNPASPAGMTSPRTYARLVPREEPPAALGRRPDDIADRRNGMTAMSFLALSDSDSRTASTKTSIASLAPRQSAATREPAPPVPKSRFEQVKGRSGGDVVAHIIPPEELSKIAHGRPDPEMDVGAPSDSAMDAQEMLPSADTAGGNLLSPAPQRQRGPVVPPRKPMSRSTSLGPAGIPSPGGLSPAPLRVHKSSAPDFGPTWTRRTPPSALTLPTIDRPSNMGSGDSPITSGGPGSPGTPSRIDGTPSRIEDRRDRVYPRSDLDRSASASPMVGDGEFGTVTGSNSTTGSHYGPLDDDDEPALTPATPLERPGGIVGRRQRSNDSGDPVAQTPKTGRLAEGSTGDEIGDKAGDRHPRSNRLSPGKGAEPQYSSAKASPVSPFSLTTPIADGSPGFARRAGDEAREGEKHPSMRHLPEQTVVARREHEEEGKRDRFETSEEQGESADEMSLADREILERAQAKEAMRLWLGAKPRRADRSA